MTTGSSAVTTRPTLPPPPLEWQPTKETLHRWVQIVGEIRIASPPRNHWWHVPRYLHRILDG